MIASILITISVLFDIGVWYFVKNLKVFDDEYVHSKNEVGLNTTKKTFTSEENINNTLDSTK